MADLIRLGNVDVVIQKDKLGSPIGGSDDGNLAAFGGGINNFVGSGGGGVGMTAAGGGAVSGVAFDMGDLQQELDQDEFDGINMLNGKSFNIFIYFKFSSSKENIAKASYRLP